MLLRARRFENVVFFLLLVVFSFLPKFSFSANLFPQRINISTGDKPGEPVIADFNQNGHLDIAVNNSGSNSLGIFLGSGDGTFFDAPNSPISVNGPGALSLVLLVGDNQSDLATSSTFLGQVTLLKSNGDGTFSLMPQLSTGNGPFSVEGIDFNEDGLIDLVVANSNDDNISLFKANPDGSFTVFGAPIAVGNNPEVIVSGDFNNDSHFDLIVTNTGATNSSVLLGQGNGTFIVSLLNCGLAPGGIVAGDLNKDGNLDVVVANLQSDNLNIFLGKGDGSFNEAIGSSIGVEDSPGIPGLGDFNNDGILDIAVPNQGSDNVSILLGKGDGTFTLQSSIQVGDFPNAIGIGDFNEDGKSDIVITNVLSNNITILFANKDPSLSTPTYEDGKLKVTYQDNDNELPDSSTGGSIKAKIDGGAEVDMTEADSSDDDVTDGKIFQVSQSLSEGSHSVEITASDGTYSTTLNDTVTVPTQGSGGCSFTPLKISTATSQVPGFQFKDGTILYLFGLALLLGLVLRLGKRKTY